jgi:hypothetical protein
VKSPKSKSSSRKGAGGGGNATASMARGGGGAGAGARVRCCSAAGGRKGQGRNKIASGNPLLTRREREHQFVLVRPHRKHATTFPFDVRTLLHFSPISS